MDVFRKYQIEKVLNKVLALVAVITFFGFCSRDLKENAPTVFALASILVYTSIKNVLNYFSHKNHAKKVLEDFKKEMREKVNNFDYFKD